MSKKLVCLALAGMLVTAAVVYAAPVGSKMTGDLVQLGSVESSTGATIAPDFAIDTKAETDGCKTSLAPASRMSACYALAIERTI